MTVPLMVLAVLSVFGGVLLINDWIVDWLEPVVGPEEHRGPADAAPAISAARVRVSWSSEPAIAYQHLRPRRRSRATAPTRVSPLTKAARADLYGDAFNEAAFMRPGQYLTRSLVYVDNRGVDGAVNGIGSARRRHVRAGPPLADRLRPLLRAVDARAAPRSSCWRCWR